MKQDKETEHTPANDELEPPIQLTTTNVSSIDHECVCSHEQTTTQKSTARVAPVAVAVLVVVEMRDAVRGIAGKHVLRAIP